MLTKIIRIIAVLFAVLAASTVLPRLYRMTFSQSSSYKSVTYSEILKDFIITDYVIDNENIAKSGEYVYHDRKGRNYAKEELSGLLPLDNVSQLAYERRFPDTICGVAVTPEQVAAEAFSMRYSANRGLYYGLFELRDKKGFTTRKLEPKDLFRINEKGIQFLAANTPDTAKSRLFNEQLEKLGFLPPAQMMWTPVDKAESERLGYYILDGKGDLYNLSVVLSVPEVTKWAKPENKNIENVVFSKTPEFMALFITEDGASYLQQNDLSYQRLPLPDVGNAGVVLEGNLFFRTFTYHHKNSSTTYVLDRDYQPVDSCTITLPDNDATLPVIASGYLFPFNIRLTVWDGFKIQWAPFIHFIWFNLLLASGAAWYRRKKGYAGCNGYNWTDIIIVALSGIFGLIGILSFPLKKSKQELSNHPQ